MVEALTAEIQKVMLAHGSFINYLMLLTMIDKLTANEIDNIARMVKETLFISRSNKLVTVFLCGADVKDDSKARHHMAKIFSTHARYEVLYPEDVFDDLLSGHGQYSLLKMEGILADSVDAIVLFPESPGSFAELGAFSNIDKLACKTIILANKKYRSNKSFINFGPNRLIKATKTGKIYHINYDHLTDSVEKDKIYKKINDAITEIKKRHPVTRDIANILEAENFVLPCVYLIENINNITLYRLMEVATKQDKTLCEIATKSALGRLVVKGYIIRNPSGYSVTISGARFVRETLNSSNLDKARLEIMNAENRRRTRVQYSSIKPRTPLASKVKLTG